MPRRLQNPRLAKSHRSYDVEDVMRLYDCHRNTVYHWIKEGLRPNDDQYPRLFHGSTLNEFHRDRRSRGKRPCGPGQVYCVVCRSAQLPAGGIVDYQPTTAIIGTIIAICPNCDRLIRRHVGPTQLADFEARCRVSILPHKHT
jgi:hypothetical protein